MKHILTINPGSTSTKLSVFEVTENTHVNSILEEDIEHSHQDLEKYEKLIDQLPMRTNCVKTFINRSNIKNFDCIVSRGGLVRPVEAGSYKINGKMLDDLSNNSFGTHASNLGALIADTISQEFNNCPAIIIDPPSVDEFNPLARYSGFPDIERKSQLHALNIRITAKKAAQDLKTNLTDVNFIAAHIGGGISVVPLQKGRMIDANNALDGGPFSPTRAGTLPITQLVDLCYSDKYPSAKALINVLLKESGLFGYLGTADGKEIIQRIQECDKKAEEVFTAMAYQISKEIGAMAAVLKGDVRAIILTGGLARQPLTDWITAQTNWIAPVLIYAGEQEERALAEAGARFLHGQETLKEY